MVAKWEKRWYNKRNIQRIQEIMMLEFIKKQIKAHWDVVPYLIFGVLTTVVNYMVYLPCLNFLGFSAAVSNCIAWVVAVTFAFLTNKPFVFQSHDWSRKTVVPEFTKFIATRISSGVLETVILLIAVDTLGGNGNIWKLVTQVMVIVVNYVGSKLLVFKKK